MKITIYHNPRWGKSRDSVRILEDSNLDFTVVEYLKVPPNKEEILYILSLLKISATKLIRTSEKEYKENNISSIDNDKKLIDMIVNFPKLMQRPIIIVGDRAVIGRPPEKILEIIWVQWITEYRNVLLENFAAYLRLHDTLY